jgi:hypothetical protein
MTATVTAERKPESQSGRTTTYVWLILSAITVVTWWLAPGHSGGHAMANVPITVAVVALGFIKGRMIIRYFMEVRTAPRWLKITTDAWLVVLWAAILAIYLY